MRPEKGPKPPALGGLGQTDKAPTARKDEGIMKYRTTAKALREGYYTIISVGYCGLQCLLSYESPIAYSAGVYGWNFDVYQFGGVAIATGYRGMPSQHSKADYQLIREYEDKAQGKTAEEKRALIKGFIGKARA